MPLDKRDASAEMQMFYTVCLTIVTQLSVQGHLRWRRELGRTISDSCTYIRIRSYKVRLGHANCCFYRHELPVGGIGPYLWSAGSNRLSSPACTRGIRGQNRVLYYFTWSFAPRNEPSNKRRGYRSVVQGQIEHAPARSRPGFHRTGNSTRPGSALNSPRLGIPRDFPYRSRLFA